MTSITEPVFGNIPLNMVRESTTNPRKHFDPTKLQDLMNSIKSNGLGQPILVRPHPDKENAAECVEIVAGARRFRASQMAMLESIPAIVRDMSDQEVLEFQLVENLQREDVHEIEEAEGYQSLMNDYRMTADDVAAKVGKSRSYVYGRLKLCGLAQEVRDACFAGTIDASTALLIARIPVQSLQEKAAQEIVKGYGYGALEPMSYRRAKEHIRTHYMLDFNRAPFMISDVTLVPSAGACGDCPKRTGNQPEIFTDVGSPDVCTDSDCWFSKTTAHGARTLKQAADNGIPIHEVKRLYDAPLEGTVGSDESIWRFTGCNHLNGDVSEVLKDEDLPEPVMYVKTEDGEVYPRYEKSAMQAALEKAGVCKVANDDDDDADDGSSKLTPEEIQKKQERAAIEDIRKAAAEWETKTRIEAYKRVRQDTIDQEGMSLAALRAVLKFMLADYSMPDLPKELDDLYPFNASDEDATRTYIDQADAPELEALMLDMFVGNALHYSPWDLDENHQVKTEVDEDDAAAVIFAALIEDKAIDIDAIRAELAPAAEEKPAAKKAKKPKAEKEAAVEPAPTKPAKAKKEKATAAKQEPVASWPFPTGDH